MIDEYIKDMERRVAEINFETAVLLNEPFALYKAKLYPDGDKWCALFGVNIQEGVVGFGSSPDEAVDDFNSNWFKKTKEESKPEEDNE